MAVERFLKCLENAVNATTRVCIYIYALEQVARAGRETQSCFEYFYALLKGRGRRCEINRRVEWSRQRLKFC